MTTPRPYDEKQECLFTATLIAHPSTLIDLGFFKPEMAYSARYRPILESIWRLWATRHTIAPSTIADDMLSAGTYEQSGGLDYLTDLSAKAQLPSVAVELAQSILDQYLRRQEIELAESIIKNALDRGQAMTDRHTQLTVNWRRVEQISVSDARTMTGATSIEYYLDLLEQLDNQPPNTLRFPWEPLRRRVPALPGGTLVGLLADPGGGKTSFLDSLGEAWWALGKRVVQYHLEDSQQTKLHRRLTRWTGISVSRLQRVHDSQLKAGNYLNDNEYKAVISINKRLAAYPGDFTLVHCPGWTMPQILAHAERLHRANPVDVIMVDYINKVQMTDRGFGLTSAQAIAADLEDLKSFCESGGSYGQTPLVGIIAGQFDKESGGRRKRTLAGLSGTKALQDKAQVGLIIDPDGGGLRVDKANDGVCGAVAMRFIGQRYLWTDDMAWNIDDNGGQQ